MLLHFNFSTTSKVNVSTYLEIECKKESNLTLQNFSEMFQFPMCIHPDKNCKLAISLTIRQDLLENLSVSCLSFRKIVCNATMCEIFLTILNSRRRLTCKTTALHRQFSSHKLVTESVNSSGKKVLPPIDGRNEVEPQQTPHTNQQALSNVHTQIREKIQCMIFLKVLPILETFLHYFIEILLIFPSHFYQNKATFQKIRSV